MAKYQVDDGGSVVLSRQASGGNFKLWSAISGGSFRRMIIDTMRRGTLKSPKQMIPILEYRSKPKGSGGSVKLAVLLRQCSEEEAVRQKVKALEDLKGAVKKLQFDQDDDVLAGAVQVRRLAKQDMAARATLALLGAIPPLVSMIESEDHNAQIAALYGLLNLGIGNEANKSAIIKAGAVDKMLKLIETANGSPRPAIAEAIVANFLSLSALDSIKPIIGSSGAIPFLFKTLKNLDETSSSQLKSDSLLALYNLSISLVNIQPIVKSDVVPFLVCNLGDMEVSERILSILSNVVSTSSGRKAMSDVPDSFAIMINVLNWNDSPECQEKASYILMVMAHKSYGDRQLMIEAGIASTLLELTLLGSALAQKSASRLFECLGVDKGKQALENSRGDVVSEAVSVPICGSSLLNPDRNQQIKECVKDEGDGRMSAENKAVKDLVQQSLQNNIKRIVKRANLPQEFVPSDHFRSLASSSTSSKSFPF